jgi:hypothetical protein
VSDHDDALRWGPDDEDLTVPSPVAPSDREPGFFLTAVFGGLYVIWALGWVLGLANQTVQPLDGVLDQVMFRVGDFLAYIATPLWFVGVLWLGTNWSVRTRAGVLLAGLIILIPWPFILPVVF